MVKGKGNFDSQTPDFAPRIYAPLLQSFGQKQKKKNFDRTTFDLFSLTQQSWTQ